MLYADGHLIFRHDRGQVLLIEATPDAPRVKGRFQTPDGEGPGWAGVSQEQDWTLGCVALSDGDIEFLAERVFVGTRVEIVP